MRGWVRNLKAIYRGIRLNFGEGGQEQEPQAGEDEGGGPWGAVVSGIYFQEHHSGPSPAPAPTKAITGPVGTSPKAVMTALLPPRGGFPVHGSKRSSGFGGTKGGFLTRES